MSDEILPRCPWCGNARRVYAHGSREFFCDGCKRIFDGIDDGDVGYQGPERYAERKEAFQLREQARKTGRCRR